MTRGKMSRHKTLFMSACLAVALAVTLASSLASAACTATLVEYSPILTNGNPHLLIQCGGTNFVSVVSPPGGCASHARTLDTLKIWLSIAQGALLSGKGLNIYSTSCGGMNMMTTIDLVQ